MIIDVHAHLGIDVVFDEEIDEKELLAAYEEYGIDGSIVQPYLPRIYIEDHQKIHNRIYELTKTPDMKIWGMASINPHFRPEDYDREAKRCIKDLGFIALKITPIGHACHPSSKDAFHVWEIAKELKVPLMIHTGAGIPFSDPISLVKALDAFPEVTCVMAHAGSELHNQQATYLASKYDNLFLEPSWVGVLGVHNMLNKLGAGKLLYSSDNINNIPVELAKYKSLIKDPGELEKVLWKNAAEIFKLDV